MTEKRTDTLAIYMNKTSYPYGTEPPVITYDPNGDGEEKLFSYSGKLWDGTSYGPSDAVPTEAGEYTVSIIYEKENYIYYGAQPFSILPASIAGAGVTLDPEEFIYDGLEKSVTVSVKIGNKTLTENVDYTVSGASAADVGPHTVTITGRGNCKDKATVVFTISSPKFGPAAFTLPAGIKNIGAHAFDGAFIGDEVVAHVPDGCGSIGTYAFKNCISLTQIHIPGTCEIQAGAFSGCDKVYIFSAAGNVSAKNYCDTHDNCLFVPGPGKREP